MVAAAEVTMVAAAEVIMVAAEELTMVAAEVTMVTVADVPTSVTMAEATMVDAADMAGMVATDGMAEIGAIHTTVTDRAGDSGLAGRIGVGDGDTRTATAIALGITPPTPIIIRRIALRVTHVLPMGPTTPRHRIPVQNPGATPGSLQDQR
jgi:type II secretory pathway component HofQ